jgi:hypothetical protein
MPFGAAAAAARTAPGFRFSAAQTAALQAAFAQQTHPSAAERQALANRLRVTQERVKNWYSNRRTAVKAAALQQPLAQQPPAAAAHCEEASVHGAAAGAAAAQPRRGPGVFTEAQLHALRAAFAACDRPSLEARRALAARLHVTERQIFDWFYYRRERGAQAVQAAHPGAAAAVASLQQPAHISKEGTANKGVDESGGNNNDARAAVQARNACDNGSDLLAQAVAFNQQHAAVATPPLTLATLAPLTLRRSDVAALAAAPATALAPHGGLATLLTGAYVRIFFDASAAGSSDAAPCGYRLLPICGCSRDASSGALQLLLPAHGGTAVASVQQLSSGATTPHEAAAAARAAAAPGAPRAATHAQLRDKAAALAAALAAAAAEHACADVAPPPVAAGMASVRVCSAAAAAAPQDKMDWRAMCAAAAAAVAAAALRRRAQTASHADAPPPQAQQPMISMPTAGAGDAVASEPLPLSSVHVQRVPAAVAPASSPTSRKRSAAEAGHVCSPSGGEDYSRSRGRGRGGSSHKRRRCWRSPSRRRASPEAAALPDAAAAPHAGVSLPPAAAQPALGGLPLLSDAVPLPAASLAPPELDAAAVVWFYRTPKCGVQGPMPLAQLARYRAHLTKIGQWASLRVWRTGQPEAQAVLLAALLP